MGKLKRLENRRIILAHPEPSAFIKDPLDSSFDRFRISCFGFEYPHFEF